MQFNGGVKNLLHKKNGYSIFAIRKVQGVFFEESPGGEIGRRTVFRSQRSQGCAGSNPVPGTWKKGCKYLLTTFFDMYVLVDFEEV